MAFDNIEKPIVKIIKTIIFMIIGFKETKSNTSKVLTISLVLM